MDAINTDTSELNSHSYVEIADLIKSKSTTEQVVLFSALSPENSSNVFEYLPFKTQKSLLYHLPSENISALLNTMSPDDRTALLEKLNPGLVTLLVKYLNPQEKAMTIKLLGYPENSIGRLMTPDYISIQLNWTVREVLDYIREKGRDTETVSVIYAVDKFGKLLDDFRIRQFLFASLDTKVADLADNKFIALNVEEDASKAINLFRRYDRVALPVIDSHGILLGIVTVDDIMDVAAREDTEDMLKLGGVSAIESPYLDVPFFSLMKKRVGWLVILFVGELFTASAMGYYEDELSKALVLTLFIPLIISSGGNAGSQASTLIIRSLALGEVRLKDWWRIMRREIFSGLFLGCVLGIIGFFRVTLWSQFTDIYGSHWLLLAYTVCFSLVGVVLWGTIIGSMLPIILKRLGFDPAVSSTPFVATLVDVTGLVIYFTIALLFLQGTLL